MIDRSTDIAGAIRKRRLGPPLKTTRLLDPYRFAAAGGGSTDPNYAFRSLILPFNDANGTTSPVDYSSYAHTMSRQSNAVVSNTLSKWYTTSADLYGGSSSSRFFCTTDASLAFGNGEFSFGFWYYIPTSYYGDGAIYSDASTYGGFFQVQIRGSGGALILTVFDAGSNNFSCTGGTVALNTWSYVQARRRNGVAGTDRLELAVAGTQVATTSLTAGTSLLSPPGSTISIGNYAGSGGTYVAVCNLQDFVVSKGLADAFTVPTGAAPTTL